MSEDGSGERPPERPEPPDKGDKPLARTSSKRGDIARLTQPGMKTVYGVALLITGVVMAFMGFAANIVGVVMGSGVTLILKDAVGPPPKE